MQTAFDRFSDSGLATAEETFVSVGKESLDLALEQLPELVRENFIVEPALRDTAAAVGLETIWVMQRHGPCVIASLGSDHYVGKPDRFVKALRAAEEFIQREPGYLVTIGCEPARVETGYGYIEKGEGLGEFNGVCVHKVDEFTEKPDARTAQEYVESGNYLWNANFFVWHSETLMKQFREFEPGMYQTLIELEEGLKSADAREVVRSTYPRLKKVAIDYAVLEPAARAGRMAVVPVSMEWSDIGSWATLTDAFPPDSDGNLFMAPVLSEETSDTTIVVRNPDRKVVAAIGLQGLAIVDTKDALLICRKDQCAMVKRLVQQMRESDQWDRLV